MTSSCKFQLHLKQVVVPVFALIIIVIIIKRITKKFLTHSVIERKMAVAELQQKL